MIPDDSAYTAYCYMSFDSFPVTKMPTGSIKPVPGLHSGGKRRLGSMKKDGGIPGYPIFTRMDARERRSRPLITTIPAMTMPGTRPGRSMLMPNAIATTFKTVRVPRSRL